MHQLKQCQRCDAYIVFLITKNGKWMPCNSESVDADDEHWIKDKHVIHFDTCPAAKDFKKDKKNVR